MAGGRPTEYAPWMAEKAMELLSQGKSLTYCAARIGIARSTIYEWKQQNQEFSDAINVGLALAQAHWEDILENAATGSNKDANPATLIFTMKNRFREDWPDTQDIKNKLSGGVLVGSKQITDVSDEDLLAVIQEGGGN